MSDRHLACARRPGQQVHRTRNTITVRLDMAELNPAQRRAVELADVEWPDDVELPEGWSFGAVLVPPLRWVLHLESGARAIIAERRDMVADDVDASEAELAARVVDHVSGGSDHEDEDDPSGDHDPDHEDEDEDIRRATSAVVGLLRAVSGGRWPS